MAARNVVVAQSGGPTCVINNSLRGIVETCRRHPGTFGTIYAGHFGIEGILKEALLDLSATPDEEIALLRTSPAAGGIGTCRYKLKKGQDQDFERVVDVFRAHDVGYFFYIGGNDSQDTAHKVERTGPRARAGPGGHRRAQDDRQRPGRSRVHAARPLARLRLGRPVLRALRPPGQRGELGLRAGRSRAGDPGDGPEDRLHPGGGPAGRPGAEAADPDLPHRVGPDAAAARRERRSASSRPTAAASSSSARASTWATWAPIRDNFGHVQFSSSQQTVAQIVVNYLNTLKFPVPGKARGQVPGTDQRNAIAYASVVDLDEAYGVGCHAVEVARKDGNGWMATILRDRSGTGYSVHYDKVPLEQGGQLRAVLPQALAGSQPDRRHRRVHRLRPAPDRRGLGERADGPRPPPVRPDRPQVRARKLADYVPQTYRKG